MGRVSWPLFCGDRANHTGLLQPLLKGLKGRSGQNVALALAATNISTVKGDEVLARLWRGLSLNDVFDDLNARFALDRLADLCRTISCQGIVQLLHGALGVEPLLAKLACHSSAERSPAVTIG